MTAQQGAVEALIREEIPSQVKVVRAQMGQLDLHTLLGLEAASEDDDPSAPRSSWFR